MAYRQIIRHGTVQDYTNPFAEEEPLSSLEQLNRQILNSQQRLASVGMTPAPLQTQPQNYIMKGLQLLDAPRNALWKALGVGVDPKTGESSGTQVIDKVFGKQQNDKNLLEKAARWVGSTGLEILGDPLNYVTFGLGGLAKGALTGVGKTMAKETAETLARSAAGEITPETIQKLATRKFTDLAKEKVPSLGEDGYKRIAQDAFSGLKGTIDLTTPEHTAISLLEHFKGKGEFVKLTDDEMLERADNLRFILQDDALTDDAKRMATMTLFPDFKKEVSSVVKQTQKEIREKRDHFYKTVYGEHPQKELIETKVGVKELSRKLAQNEYLPTMEYGGAVKQAIADANKEMVARQGVKLAKDTPHLFQGAYDDITGALADSFLRQNGIEKMVDKGLTIVGQTIIPGYKLQDVGAQWSKNLIKKHPNLKPFTDALHSVFNTKFMKNTDDISAQAFHAASSISKGAYNVALNQAKHKFREFEKVFSAMPDGEAQKGYIKYIIENNMEIPKGLENVNPQTIEVARQIRDEFQRMLKVEMQIGLKGRVATDKTYMARTMSQDALDLELKRYNYSRVTDALNVSDVTKSRMYRTDFDTAQYLRKVDTSSESAKIGMADAGEALKERLSGLPEDHPLSGVLQNFNPSKLRKHQVGAKVPLWADDIKKMRDYLNEESMTGFSVGLADSIDDFLQYADGIDKFYEEDGVISYLSRLLQHEKLVANTRERDDFLNVFAVQTSDADELAEAFANPNKKVVIKGVPNIYNLKIAKGIAKETEEEGSGAVLEKASGEISKAVKSLQKKAIDAHGAPLSISEDEYKALYQAGHLSPQAYVMPAGAYENFMKTHQRQMDEGMSNIGSLVDTFHRIWKPTVTGLRPDFHIRNLIGSSAQSMLGSGIRALDPRDSYIGSALVTGNKDNIIVNMAGQDIPVSKLHNYAVANGIYQTMHRTDLGTVKREITGATKIKKGVKGDVLKKVEQVGDIGRNVGNAIEDRIRAAYFVTNTRKALELGMDLPSATRFAGEEVKRYHFDYSDLTVAEKSLLQRAMPFYTWSRKNIPLQLEMLLNEPRKYANLSRAVENASDQFAPEESAVLPDYAKSDLALATPFKSKEGMPIYLSGLFPMSDVRRLDPSTYLKEGLGMLSPLAKMPVELGMNREILTGAPISKGFEGETVPWMGQQVDPRIAYLANQFGIFRNASNAVSGGGPSTFGGINTDPTTRLLTMDMGNSLVKQLNIDKAAENRLRDYLRELQNQMQSYEFENGAEIPTVRELLKMQKPPKYQPIR